MMLLTIAFAAVAYAGFLACVLAVLTAAKRGDQGVAGELPRALLRALSRKRRPRAA